MSDKIKTVTFETKNKTSEKDRAKHEEVKNNEENNEEKATEKDESGSENITEQEDKRSSLLKFKNYIKAKIENQEFYVNPEGDVIFLWMVIPYYQRLVTFAVIYNFWMVILRITFKEMREEAMFRRIFGSVDIFCDAVCILDIFFSNRVAFLEEGLIVKDPNKLSANYRKKISFKLDILAVIPLGTIALFIGGASDIIHINFDLDNDHIIIPLLRLPRLLKLHSMINFFDVCDSRTSNPNRLRAFKLTMYLGIVIHWIGCIYYMVSEGMTIPPRLELTAASLAAQTNIIGARNEPKEALKKLSVEKIKREMI
ncbi:cyclic nucleotide-gated channel rod photoreceptor subunit alpha-like [Anneissia japonica]|uniref:cyclic nucleotide-gated channel rod photoreceptor subunit alpha-like n=1 Tax=Anneissia japonica TaxID=1529436 RepID=UPI00142591CB|nr:cyclic nucleotide-gated channel rod photoreceptor subunit alpha-like [Anneissia japonica]